DLQLPDLGTLVHTRHLKKHMRSDTPLECRIKVRCQIGCKDHDTVEGFQFAKKDIHSQVHLTVMRQGGTSGPACRDGISFIKEEDRVLVRRRPKNSSDVFRSLAYPHRLCLSVIDNDKLQANCMGNCLSANSLSRPGRSCKVKCQTPPFCVPLP